ncbi:ATP-binding protein [Micromonospora chersina]|uniref:ATP-binding protein n=1 Tax=Micromonospora chersina TaxID=47854 RepID=UPI003715CC13
MTVHENGMINVAPHPRLLGVLGDIEFQPWQCLAELIDNGLDEFLRHPEASDETPTVGITLPARTSTPRAGEVWVRDNGPGMTLEQLNNALRAGWTSNARYGRLGLFGVGFNIATARLGRVAQVRTARREDPYWTSVTIDLRAMEAGGHFDLPVSEEPKTSPDEHGTDIVIRDLKPEHHDTLSRGQAKVKATLGDIYSYLLEHRDIRIVVDGEAIKPRRACVWDKSRFVVRSGERIPAVIDINEKLADRAACQDCGLWQDPDVRKCEQCGSERVEVRERRIWGWLGIQRYLHKSDYGIDFIRNGRKILIRDVQLFNWIDPDDPSGRGEQEYPIEVPGTGRIVGEIHIDHVQVNYQKNAFEYDTPEWKKVVHVLRGRGPLRPKIAKELNYKTNTSPLARLFNGYRRNDPGLNYLIPADDKRAIHEKAKEWADLFRKGVAEYQTDEKWYEAAKQFDEPKSAPPSPSPTDEPGDILAKKGLLPPKTTDPSRAIPPQAQPPRLETEDDRRARWRASGVRMPDMEAKYGLPGHGAALNVTVWLIHGHQLSSVNSPERLPVYVGAGRGSQVEVFVDGDHPVFVDFAVDTRDLIVMELGEYIRVRDNSDQNLSALFYEIKKRCLPDHKITGAFIRENASRLLSRVREAMLPVIAGNATGYWSYIDVEGQDAAQRTFAVEGGSDSWQDALETGEWISYVPASALARLLQHKPEAFMDGNVFKSGFIGLTDQIARKLAADRIVGFVADVAVLAERGTRRSPEELQRGRLSCYLLEQELSPAVEALE